MQIAGGGADVGLPHSLLHTTAIHEHVLLTRVTVVVTENLCYHAHAHAHTTHTHTHQTESFKRLVVVHPKSILNRR